MEPTSNCSSDVGGTRCAVSVAFMQGSEATQIILFYSDLRDRWPQQEAARLQRALPYAKRLNTHTDFPQVRATLAGIALALQVLRHVASRAVDARELRFPAGGKPYVEDLPDFSISHSGVWVACAVASRGRIGLDIEAARALDPRALRLVAAGKGSGPLEEGEALRLWTAKEAALKALGASLAEAAAVQVGETRVAFRGQSLYRQDLETFAPDAACLVTSEPAREPAIRRLALEEAFAL